MYIYSRLLESRQGRHGATARWHMVGWWLASKSHELRELIITFERNQTGEQIKP